MSHACSGRRPRRDSAVKQSFKLSAAGPVKAQHMKAETKALLKRTLWLAFQASTPMGMGVLHAGAAAKQTEDSLFATVIGEKAGSDSTNARDFSWYTDYVFGRMMKTGFAVKDDVVEVTPEAPRLDYQSWGATYDSASALIDAAAASLAG